ncbi:MAG: DUF1015 domain-containing protein, partial [Planctomycetota bacterium]|nr:DUF1015 domain-containing protein [Planctomycetota bacterium]
MKRDYPDIALHVPEILIPRPGIDLETWATVACDQYTSQPAYWEKVERIVGDRPSTYHLMLPEIHLHRADADQRIARIHAAMQQYLDKGLLRPLPPGFMLVERLVRGRCRLGLLVALDLEEYDYGPNSQSLIRPTEATVPERLPPRLRIREGALLEMPHILALIDDPDKTVIEPLYEEMQKQNPLYETPLMLGAGRVRGWHIAQEKYLAAVAAALRRLAEPAFFQQRYRIPSGDAKVILYAVGDGNHSLAAAKAAWENHKRELPADSAAAPASRYAMVELVNLHDAGLHFEPIHRVLFGAEVEKVLAHFQASGVVIDADEATPAAGGHVWRFHAAHQQGSMIYQNPRFPVAAAALDDLLAAPLAAAAGARIDYV